MTDMVRTESLVFVLSWFLKKGKGGRKDGVLTEDLGCDVNQQMLHLLKEPKRHIQCRNGKNFSCSVNETS